MQQAPQRVPTTRRAANSDLLSRRVSERLAQKNLKGNETAGQFLRTLGLIMHQTGHPGSLTEGMPEGSVERAIEAALTLERVAVKVIKKKGFRVEIARNQDGANKVEDVLPLLTADEISALKADLNRKRTRQLDNDDRIVIAKGQSPSVMSSFISSKR